MIHPNLQLPNAHTPNRTKADNVSHQIIMNMGFNVGANKSGKKICMTFVPFGSYYRSFILQRTIQLMQKFGVTEFYMNSNCPLFTSFRTMFCILGVCSLHHRWKKACQQPPLSTPQPLVFNLQAPN